MKFKIWLISAVIISMLSSCDDGDIIVTSFDFEEQDLQFCGGESNIVFFKINNEAQESIALNIAGTVEIFAEDEVDPITLSTTNFVTYRKFNGEVDASYFCSSIPPASPQVTIDYIAVNGTAIFTNNLVLDDNDGLPTEMEFDEDDEFLKDSDCDSIPDFYDLDDDGDNVPTSRELYASAEDQKMNKFMDTDMDGDPDYLDKDDDNDGILTINESTDGDLDPTNDTDENGLPNYLNMNIAIPGTFKEDYIVHTISRNATVELVLSDVDFENENEDILDQTINMGDITNIINDTETLTPVFIEAIDCDGL